jgi:hypothetical protein
MRLTPVSIFGSTFSPLDAARAVLTQVVPALKTTARVGPYYNTLLIQFAKQHLNPTDARKNAPSLDKAMNSIDNL